MSINRRVKNKDVFRQWSFTWQRNCYELLIHTIKWLNLKTKHCVEWKNPRKKTLHTLWFHLCKVFEQAKLKYGDRSQNSSCLWGKKEFSRKGHWGNRDVLHLHQDGGYTGNTFVKTQPNYILFYANYTLKKTW